MSASPRLVQFYNQFHSQFRNIDRSFFYTNPVFIVSTPRSGSTLLFEQLSLLNNVWTIGDESHMIFQEFPHLRFENQTLDSASLDERHADPQTSLLFKVALFALLKDNKSQKAIHKNLDSLPPSVFIEKTPRNSLNIPFIKSIFPKAKFIYLYREPKQNVSSIIEAWKKGLQTGQFVTFRNLPGWDRSHWCLLLPKKWRTMNNKSLAEIAYFQWLQSNNEIIKNLSNFERSNWISLNYDDFVNQPKGSISKIISFCNIDSNINVIKNNLQISKTSITKPNKMKWLKNKNEMNSFLDSMQTDYERIKDFCS